MNWHKAGLMYVLWCLFVFMAISGVQGAKLIDVLVTGNQHITKSAIMAHITIKKGEELSEEKVQNDLRSIQDMGYFQDVKDIREETPEGVKLTFEVLEYPKVKELAFLGNTVVANETLEGLMKVKPGDILNSNLVSQDMVEIEKYYAERGYVLAHITGFDITPDGIATVTIAEGIVESISVKGLRKTKERVVLREMKTKVGKPFNRDVVSGDVGHIHNLDLFESIESKLESGKQPETVALIVEVAEKKTGTAGLGVAYSSREQMVGFIDLTENNFQGLGRHVNVRWEFNSRNSYDLGYYEPWFDEKHTSLNFNIYDRRLWRYYYYEVPTERRYDERRRGFDITVSRPIRENTRVYAGFKNEKSDVIWLEAPQYFYPVGTVSSLTVSMVTDTRDYIANPTKGLRDSFSIEIARPILRGEYAFEKFGIDLRRYYKVSAKNVLAHRLLLGFGRGNRPFAELYRVGGADTLRGYEEDWLWGDRLFLFNTELRIPITKEGLTGVVFFDYGDAWGGSYAEHSNFSPQPGFGVGIRVETPIGPLRFDYGMGTEGGRTHFSIGHTF